MDEESKLKIFTLGILLSVVLIVGVAIGGIWNENQQPQPPHLGSIITPHSVIHKICWTDDLKVQGKIDTLPIVQTGALCAYNVKQAWKLFHG